MAIKVVCTCTVIVHVEEYLTQSGFMSKLLLIIISVVFKLNYTCTLYN